MTTARDKRVLIKFGKRLRAFRKESGMTQNELEFDAGISKNQVGNIERGEVNPSLTTIINLAKSLKISPSDLINLE